MHHIFCILDGMTDPGFDPADYPGLASMELEKMVDTCLGQPAESLGCILHHLGVRRVPAHLRGYAEALGAGIPVEPDDLVLRGSWFGVDERGLCTLPVPGPETLEKREDFAYYHLEAYKSILVFRGHSREIAGITTIPPYNCAGKPAQDFCPAGSAALEAVFRENQGSRRLLIPWGQSVSAQLPPFPQKAAVVCGATIVRGIAALLHMDIVEVPGATGDVDTDLEAKTAAALKAAEAYPFVLLHINGADEAGHRKNRAEKQAFLRKIDRTVVTPLLASGHRITVTADHGTDPDTGTHLALPQPIFTSL